MPTAIRRHLPALPEPRLRTLHDKQQANGRTLALNGAVWRRLRALVLAEQPLCPHCRNEGRLVPAVDVDHVDNDPSNNERSNLMGLCHVHHSMKTHRDMGHTGATGCDALGTPLDPCHPWNVAQTSQESPATGRHEPSPTARAHRRETGA